MLILDVEKVIQMNLDKIVIVLDHPDECRNIGAACRARANNGITHLRIVGNKADYDREKIHVLAIHAAYIYDSADFFESIYDATKDCAIAAGTTRRRGKKRKGKLYLPEEFAESADLISGGKDGESKNSKGNGESVANDGALVAVVFGNDFASLNLSHAVQIMCYHLFRKKNEHIAGYTPLSLERIDKTVEHIADSLQKIGFFSVTGRSDMERFWRGLLSRSALSESEAKYIEKIFSKAAGLAKKNSHSWIEGAQI